MIYLVKRYHFDNCGLFKMAAFALMCILLLLVQWNWTTTTVWKANDNLQDQQSHIEETEESFNLQDQQQPLSKKTEKEIDIQDQKFLGNETKKEIVKPNVDKSIDTHGFWADKTAISHHVFDSNLSKALMNFFTTENVTSLIDLGAGMGDYSKEAMTLKIFTSCYDGNPATVEISGGHCATADLSKPIHFYRHDWALSLEVGEHIPREYEDIFINNLDRVNRKGVIVSWAIPKQGGRGHVNERNNSDIIDKFVKLGYAIDEKAHKILRNAANRYWFKNTLMVFRKKI